MLRSLVLSFSISIVLLSCNPSPEIKPDVLLINAKSEPSGTVPDPEPAGS